MVSALFLSFGWISLAGAEEYQRCGAPGVCTISVNDVWDPENKGDPSGSVSLSINNQEVQKIYYGTSSRLRKKGAIETAEYSGKKLESAGVCVYLGEKIHF